VSLDPPTTLPKNDLLGGSLPPPDFASRAFVLSFDLGGDRAKGGERGFVFPIGSFTFRRPGGHAAFGPSSSAPPPLRSCFIWAIALVMALASWRRAGCKYPALISLATDARNDVT
jgi:hypothetical protein